MKVSAYSPAELQYQLKQHGLFLQTGALTTHLQSDLPEVAQGIALLYADYPLQSHSDFADFHVRLCRPNNLRRWFKPQVNFLFDSKPVFKPLPLDQALPMLEWGLNWCVSSHVNDCLVIHAAVVEKNGSAALLPAPPGSGKSTLCAALVNRGWRLLSDELALLRVTDGKLMPLPRPVSLKNQSIGIIQHFAPDAVFSRKVSDTMKGTIALMRAPSDSVLRASEVAQPGWIIFPRYQPDTPAQLTALPPARALLRVADNAFNYSLLGITGFKVMARLMDECSCFEFHYRELDEAISVFDELAR